jgi:peroxisomal 2,4-dienoyl-CoA reductase
MCQAAFPHLKKSGDSLIINVSATLHYGATWYQSHASAAKAAIDSLTRSFALEWGEYGIRVNSLAPGPIADTAGMTKLSGGRALPEKPKDIPIRRFGQTWDIAMNALFLACSGGSLITGAMIVVDGGQWLSRPQMAPRDIIRELSKGIEKKSREVGIPTKSKL